MASKTVFNHVTDWMYIQQDKHDLGDDYVDYELGRMSRKEFLQAISDAIEESLKGLNIGPEL